MHTHTLTFFMLCLLLNDFCLNNNNNNNNNTYIYIVVLFIWDLEANSSKYLVAHLMKIVLGLVVLSI